MNSRVEENYWQNIEIMGLKKAVEEFKIVAMLCFYISTGQIKIFNNVEVIKKDILGENYDGGEFQDNTFKFLTMTGEGVDNFDIDIFCERNELIMIKKIHFPPGNSMIIYIFMRNTIVLVKLIQACTNKFSFLAFFPKRCCFERRSKCTVAIFTAQL